MAPIVPALRVWSGTVCIAVVDRTAAGGGQMLIAYSVNKEDIELMIVPLSALR